jgi:Ca2+-binding RTX toxin-like protein
MHDDSTVVTAMPSTAGVWAAPPAVLTPDVWDLHARPDDLVTAAAGWRGVATTVRTAADEVNAQVAAVHNGGWQGTTADTFDAHRRRLITDLDAAADHAIAVAGTLEQTAAGLNSAQSRLTTQWAYVTDVPFEYDRPMHLVFRPATAEERQTVLDSIAVCQSVRGGLDAQMGTDAATLRQHASAFTAIAADWLSVADGTTPPFTVPAEVAGVINTGDEILIDTGTGDDSVQVGTDPATGLAVVTVNGLRYTFPPTTPIVIRTGAGNDEIAVDPGTRLKLTLLGGTGNDVIRGGDGGDTILGLDGDDKLYGGAGSDRISGGSGRDYIEGGSGNEILDGGLGNDTLYGLDGADTLSGGEGQDYLEGGTGNDTLLGGAGNDILSGGVGDDNLRGGAGDDVFYDGRGHDVNDGGTGTDKVFGEATDTSVGVEHMVTVQISDLGRNITVEGSPEFRARVQADLEMLRSSPDGQRMLTALDQAHADTAGGFLWWHHDGDTLTIRELGAENGGASMSGRTVTIAYNPSYDETPMNGDGRDLVDSPPVVVLYHEMAHTYDFMNNTFAPGIYTGADNPGAGGIPTPNLEREAVGLPIDGDNNPATPPALYAKHPAALTENALRAEMGAPRRDRY